MKLEFSQAEIEDMVRRQLVADGFEPLSGVTFLPKKRFLGSKMTAHVHVKKELTPVPVLPEPATSLAVVEPSPEAQESSESDPAS